MEDLIRQIVEIEDKAQELVRGAKEAQSGLETRIRTDSAALGCDIEKQMNDKNASLRNIEEGETEEKIRSITEQTEKSLSELEEKYNENKGKWVDDIVAGVIGRR